MLMVTTTNLPELNQLVNAEHSDPHHILGMHPIVRRKKIQLVVRVFIPQARSITVVDAQDSALTYPASKTHLSGFFEAIIIDREPFPYILDIEGHDGVRWTTADPYSFSPFITDMDMHLFGEGTHYQIFDKLGAHVKTIDGVQGVAFAVWAPNAVRVSVIGSFNSWDGRRNPMRLLGASGIWELFVPGVCIRDQYKFEIKTRDGALLEKSDPYGFFAELRPSHSSLVFDINRYAWQDEEWMASREKHDPMDGPVNIYEVHLGAWKRVLGDGNRFMSYLELTEQLIPYVKDMGYTHIELMPVEEHPFDGSWGYQVTGYYAPTSRYGSPDEFMAFVDACHQNGIGVILDWVPAHFPKDAHGLARFDGTALYEHQDPRQGEHPDWGTYIFNYGRKEVKNFLIANALFWLEKYHIDGLRVDAVASMLYLDYGKSHGQWIPNIYGGNQNLDAVEFIKHMNSVILGRMPHVMMIAEESTSWAGVSAPAEQGGLGFNLKWNMGWMNDMLSYMAKDPIYRKHHHNQLTFSIMYAYSERFVLVLSHDEVVHEKGSLLNKMPGDYWQKFANLRLFYGFMMGHPGKKLLFMGGELGQFSEWSEARALDWFLLDYEKHEKLQKYVQALNAFYTTDVPLWHNDFQGGGFDWIDCNNAEQSLVSFFRKGPEAHHITVFVCNFTPVVYHDYRVGVPLAGTYTEVLNSDDTSFGGSGVINPAPIKSEPIVMHSRGDSITLSIPPLGVSVLKLTLA